MSKLIGLLTTCTIFAVLCISLLSNTSASASSTLVYKEYFHTKAVDSIMHRWRVNQSWPRITRSPRGIKHLGIFKTNDTLSLELQDLPIHQRITVEFGFHIIGSWDGEADNDRFICFIDEYRLLDESFSNTTSKQSWPAAQPRRLYPARAGARNSNMLAYPSRIPDVYLGPMDASYVTTKSVDHQSNTLKLTFTASLNDVDKGLEFKGWGLEYVVVYAVDSTDIVNDVITSESTITTVNPIEVYTGKDIREIAEFQQNEDFPGLKAGSQFERDLHITIVDAECRSCGDYCLWYTYRYYTDGWINVWSNKPAKGVSLFSAQISQRELDSVRTLISECLQYGIKKEYHDAEFEEAHPDLTHCTLAVRMSRYEAHTEVYAADPAILRTLMDYLLNVISRYGWVPSPG